jgi:hypothetical protein
MTRHPSDPRYAEIPDWQHEFENAVQDSGQDGCYARLQAAKAAISRRLRTKTEYPPGILERIALNDAIHLLRVLRKENLPDPDQYKKPGAAGTGERE